MCCSSPDPRQSTECLNMNEKVQAGTHMTAFTQGGFLSCFLNPKMGMSIFLVLTVLQQSKTLLLTASVGKHKTNNKSSQCYMSSP